MHYDNYNLHCTISIHALLAESDHLESCLLQPSQFISIHALLAESDRRESRQQPAGEISIHALLAESDPGKIRIFDDILRFLSTLSLRRATRKPCAGSGECCISIHALLAESDTPITFRHCTTYLFLSTLSLRRATIAGRITSNGTKISIHALLAESDGLINRNSHFKQKFLSTLSLRRATKQHCNNLPKSMYFYPRSPCGERRKLRALKSLRCVISIHALLAESDRALR